MAWILNDDKPIYLQLVERLSKQLVAGSYQPGDKIPSVRDLAAQAGVNPNTMQRALTELERSGLINTNRTSGRSVSEDAQQIQSVREGLAKELVSQFLKEMSELGYAKAEAIDLLTKAVKEGM